MRAQTHLESLLSKLCLLILILLPPLMIYAHIRAIGVVWNHSSGETFSPLKNYVSDYAYRSPAWWAVVSCMYGFSFVLGFISWHAANRRRTVISWLVAAAAAIAMFKMSEAARYPVGSPEVTKIRFEEELNKGALGKSKDEIWRAYLKITGKPVPKGMSVEVFLKNKESKRLHIGGIKPANTLIFVTMVGAFFIWRGGASSNSGWLKAHGVVALLLLTAYLVGKWYPQGPGLGQRISFLGMYVWMWLIFLAIRREMKRTGESAITQRISIGEG